MYGGLQRQYRRFHVSVPVRIWSRKARGGISASAGKTLVMGEETFTENISRFGCYFRLSRELAVGSKLEMEIEMPASPGIPGGVKLRCLGKVVRVEGSYRRGEMGMACIIERYRFLRQAHPSRAVSVRSRRQLSA